MQVASASFHTKEGQQTASCTSQISADFEKMKFWTEKEIYLFQEGNKNVCFDE